MTPPANPRQPQGPRFGGVFLLEQNMKIVETTPKVERTFTFENVTEKELQHLLAAVGAHPARAEGEVIYRTLSAAKNKWFPHDDH